MTDLYIGPGTSTDETLGAQNGKFMGRRQRNCQKKWQHFSSCKTEWAALQREINDETGLNVEIHAPVEQWSFYKTPDQLIKGITYECAYRQSR